MLAKPRKRKKKKEKKGSFFKVAFFVSILVFIGLLGFSILRIQKRRNELTERIESLKEEIEALEKESEELESGISETQKESYWEERVREQGYVKEGENPVVVLPPPQGEPEEASGEQGLWEQWSEKLQSLLARVIQW